MSYSTCVNKTYNSEFVLIPIKSVELIFDLATVHKHTFILGTCYIPPANSTNVFMDHSETID